MDDLPVVTEAQVVKTSFQNGAGGYSGTFDRTISTPSPNGSNVETDGSTVASYYMDGYSPDDDDADINPESPDTQNLIRFDNIIGPGANQIPTNATILDAKLTLTTSLAGNAQTSGPYGVFGLLQSFDSSTSYYSNFSSATNFGSRGAWWQDGSATRPVGGFGFQTPGSQDSANVTSVVQSWASGGNNYGFVVQAGLTDDAATTSNTSDGWSVRTTGFPTSDSRPKLDVTYTTASVEMNTFQRGISGYSSDTMAIVRSGANALNPDPGATPPEVTVDASTLDQTFLDGVFFTNTAGDTSSPDDLALLKFGDVFGANPGQAPTDVPVAKAWAVITTGDTSGSTQSVGPWTAHTMLRSWDTSSLHSSFGAVNGLQVGDGDISPALDSQDGMIRGSEVWFDVTDYLEGVRNGAADNGIAILTTGTADGWQIHTNGSATLDAHPQLVVYSADLGIVNPLEGDFNGDGKVDSADYVEWRKTNGDEAAYNMWRSNFGRTSGGGPLALGSTTSAVPEPGAAMLGLIASLGLMIGHKRH
jgi:hypothetical protein